MCPISVHMCTHIRHITMRKLILTLAVVLMVGTLHADFMSNILHGDYRAKTLKKAVRDSLLNGGSSNKLSSTRVRGVWGTNLKTRKLSPNGQYEAYLKGNNLYVYKKLFDTDLAVTHDEDSLILNGSADWLYNEEFDCGAMFEWSPDSKLIAFVRLDTRDVASFEWQDMLQEGNGAYPLRRTIQYPRTGTANSKATVCIYDMQYKDIRTLDLGEYEYIPRIRFVESGKLYVQTLNRDQNKMQVFEVNPKSGVSKLWYHEECEDGWVEYSNFDDWQWLTNGNVIVVSERSGWRQVYLYATNGKKISQFTRDGVDVTKCYGYDEKNKVLYYQVANTPMTRQNYRLGADGQAVALDDGKGWCELTFSDDYTRYVMDYQMESMPNRYSLYEVKRGKSVACKGVGVLDDLNRKNESLLEKWKQATNGEDGKNVLSAKEFFSFVTERGDTLNGWMIHLANAVAPKEGWPLVLLHYSGPGSQRVVEKWNKKWEYALAQKGYVVVCVDVRGTGARGQKWLHETYMNLGVKEAEDLMSTANWLSHDVPGGLLKINSERMAIGGWSYGGFETLMTMSQANSPFKCGFAIAPVTDYRLYDSGYTERFMRRLQVNEAGYLQCALPKMAQQLNGKLLIVHGLADDNVHCQNTWLYIDALVQAGKQFDMQIYPDDNHSLRKRGNYEHLHGKLLHFLSTNL